MVVALALGTLATFGFVILTLAVSKLNGRIRGLESAEKGLEKEFTAARNQAADAEAAQQFLTKFVRELPQVVHGLLASSAGRNIPKLMMGAVTRIVEPRRAIVAVRRRAAETDPDRHMRLAIAAVHPEGWIDIGHEIRIGLGEIGYAAELQRVMDRKDFDSHQPHTRKRLREETIPGFQPDLVAPMVVDGEVVGVLAVEGLKRRASDMKDSLRLLAQVGAISVQTQARYTEMKATASIDGLTGIFNKRYLTHRLAEEVSRALDSSQPLSVFIFDVDHFKGYNDQNGHVAGDRLLQSLSKLVQDNLRRDTVFGRYGGEEFLIVFSGAKREQAMGAAENIRSAIAAYPFPNGERQPLGFVSISGGVAECPVDGRNAVSLVRAADEALYRAKRAGRNRVLAHETVYLGDEALEPVKKGDMDDSMRRVAFEIRPKLDANGQPVTFEPDATPEPGMLLAISGITPPAGVPNLAAHRNPPALAAALEAAAEPAASPKPEAAGEPPAAQGRGAEAIADAAEPGALPAADHTNDQAKKSA